MEFYSLLNSYGDVVYENKKVFGKKFPEKYFSNDEKISTENFDTFFENQHFHFREILRSSKIFENQKNVRKYFWSDFFFQNFFFSIFVLFS